MQKYLPAMIFGLALAIATPLCADAESGDATVATKAANEAALKALNFADTQDFEDAKRGFIAPLPNGGVIKNAEGRTVWDLTTWDFVNDGPAPETVHPSLWRQAQLLKISGLFKVVDGIYQVRGADLANVTFIEGDDGIIVMDPGMNFETAKAALDLYYAHRPKKPVVAVIITHSHIDHFGGVAAVASKEDVASGKVKIVAPEGFAKASIHENVLGGNLQSRRVSYQYGNLVRPGAKGMLTTGLGLTTPTGTVTFHMPTDVITKTGQKMNLAGLEVEFMLAPDTEAPAELFFWIPKYKALSTAEDAVHNMHNLYSLRGAKIRDPLNWALYLREARQRWGSEAEVLYAPHHWPIWGNKHINDYLEKQAAAYQYLHDQTLRLANHGYTMFEVADMIELPPSLAREWHLRGYYGTVNHNVKAAFVKQFGWYSGNPATLHRLPLEEVSKRYVDVMGGADAVLEKAQAYYDVGDYRWVAELVNHVIFADPDNEAARHLQADALEQMGYQAEAGTWRNWFLTGAKELRDGVKELPTPNMASPDIVAAMPLDMYFEYLAMRLNGPKAFGKTLNINLDVTDTQQKYLLTVKDAVLDYTPDVQATDANATLRLDRETLNQIILGQSTLPQEIQAGRAEVNGNVEAIEDLVGMLDSFQLWYNVVTP